MKVSEPSFKSQMPDGFSTVRVAILGAVLAGIAGLFAYAGGWVTPHRITPAALVDTFQQVNGTHPGFRRNHAKGVCVTGYFESNGSGRAISKASVFAPGRVPILGRFALAGGQPFVADGPGTVRSMAILFQLADGEEWRTAMINIPVFVVRTPEAFREQMLASAPDPATGKPDPAAMTAFLAKHPETVRAMQSIRSHPFSARFANSPYYGLNAFLFTTANGETVPVRWSVVPEQPFDTGNPGATGNNYLFDALIAEMNNKPLRWHLMITVGRPGDPTADATETWPADRQQVDAGLLTFNRIDSEDTSPIRDINFDPLVLPRGMAASDDPLLSARSAAYSQSFTRRESEHKPPSAISPSEVGR